jgi:biotin transport system substrate-specific component
MHPMNPIATYLDDLRSRAERYALARDAALVVAGSLIVALSAQVAVRLPFSPVPVTAQTLAVLLVGATLGSKRGALSLLAYLVEGLAGLPVFAAGASGPAYLLGPTGGYLAGFVAAAFLTGWLVERGWGKQVGRALLAMLAGSATIYLFGLSWLTLFAGRQALALGLLPFLAGDVVKVLAGAALLPAGWRIVGRGR